MSRHGRTTTVWLRLTLLLLSVLIADRARLLAAPPKASVSGSSSPRRSSTPATRVVRRSGSSPAWNAAATHTTKYGGDDGALDDGPGVANTQEPVSGRANNNDATWVVVFGLPDASVSEIPAQLNTIKGKTATFDGYFRVWNEGHWKGPVAKSNPHHVFEVHPAWGSCTTADHSQPHSGDDQIPGVRAVEV